MDSSRFSRAIIASVSGSLRVFNTTLRRCNQSCRSATMMWVQRLKRVFNIDIEVCTQCGGPLKVIASIEDLVVIKKILEHIKEKEAQPKPLRLPESRGPSQGGLFS